MLGRCSKEEPVRGDKMAEYHVGCGLAGIYAGTLKKNGEEWIHKSDVTREAMSAVAQYFLFLKRAYRFEYQGKSYILEVREEEE